MSEIKEPLLYTDTNWEDLLDYDNKIWINIDRYKQLEKENETLKHYRCKRNCASRLAENRKLTDTEILDRYQEWLKEKISDIKSMSKWTKKGDLYMIDLNNTLSIVYLEECLKKLQELKK